MSQESKISVIEQRRQLLNEELKRTVDSLVRNYSPEKIILFGSLVNGKIHEWSDIDLVIIKETDKRFLDRIDEAIFIIYPKVGINVVVYTPDEFKKMVSERRYFILEEVIKKGKVLYERDKQLA